MGCSKLLLYFLKTIAHPKKIHIIGICQTLSAVMVSDLYLSRSNNNPLAIHISELCQTWCRLCLAELAEL